ncbi:hypothetical protein V8C42DRAFT_26425 [Trichoderma barbatum]
MAVLDNLSPWALACGCRLQIADRLQIPGCSDARLDVGARGDGSPRYGIVSLLQRSNGARVGLSQKSLMRRDEGKKKKKERQGGYQLATGSEGGDEEEEEVTEEGHTEDDNDGRLEQCNACVSELCRSPSCRAQTISQSGRVREKLRIESESRKTSSKAHQKEGSDSAIKRGERKEGSWLRRCRRPEDELLRLQPASSPSALPFTLSLFFSFLFLSFS